MWIQQLLNKLLLDDAVKEIKMLSDNKISFTLMKNLENQNCTKHINVIHYYVCRLVENGELAIK